MIQVFFFAQIRELVGMASLNLEGDFLTVEDIRVHLAQKGEKWALAMDAQKLLVAVNQTISGFSSDVQKGDEVAFFPPVTGG